MDYLTCTSSRQAWGISKIEKVNLWKAKPVADLCCAKKHSGVVEADTTNKQDLLKQGFSRILEGKLLVIFVVHVLICEFTYSIATFSYTEAYRRKGAELSETHIRTTAEYQLGYVH